MKHFRYLFVAALLTAVVLGVSSMMATQLSGFGFVGVPLPPPPVLCGCLCEDGSFIIVHAPTPNDCPSACAAACNTSS